MAPDDDARERELQKKRADAIRRRRDAEASTSSDTSKEEGDETAATPDDGDPGSPNYVAWLHEKEKKKS